MEEEEEEEEEKEEEEKRTTTTVTTTKTRTRKEAYGRRKTRKREGQAVSRTIPAYATSNGHVNVLLNWCFGLTKTVLCLAENRSHDKSFHSIDSTRQAQLHLHQNFEIFCSKCFV